MVELKPVQFGPRERVLRWSMTLTYSYKVTFYPSHFRWLRLDHPASRSQSRIDHLDATVLVGKERCAPQYAQGGYWALRG